MSIKVKAIDKGYYGEKFRKVGDCFEVGDDEFTGKYKFGVKDRDGVVTEIEKDIRWPKWMEKIEDDEFEAAGGEEQSEEEEPTTYKQHTKKKGKAKKQDSADSVI